jgi:hypothetical protein
MNHHCHHTVRRPQRGCRDGALERIGNHLEQSRPHSNAELIRRLRQVMFADVDELAGSGKTQLPD